VKSNEKPHSPIHSSLNFQTFPNYEAFLDGIFASSAVFPSAILDHWPIH
jgi:hypothetical protein